MNFELVVKQSSLILMQTDMAYISKQGNWREDWLFL